MTLSGQAAADEVTKARQSIREHELDNTLSAHERYNFLRDQQQAFLNDFVNREIRIGATVISAGRTNDVNSIGAWGERNKQYHQELNAFLDHIKSIRFLMYQVWKQLPITSKIWFTAKDLFQGRRNTYTHF